jgi:hypothetical protein
LTPGLRRAIVSEAVRCVHLQAQSGSDRTCTGRGFRRTRRPGRVGGSDEETRRCTNSGGSWKAHVKPEDLPDEILQPLLQFGRALMTHVRAQRDTSLSEHEEGVLAAWCLVAPLLLEGVLQVATTGLEQTARSGHAVQAASNAAGYSRNARGSCRRAWGRLDWGRLD